MDTESPQRVDHALLIGIDRYQYIGPDLNGCVGDVEDMRDVLVSQLQTPADRVVLLRATHLQSEPPEQRATRANIIAALTRLGDEAQPGEQVYIQYSGHGVRNDYTILPGLEADGRDEAIAPTDSGYEDPAQFYILDKELGWLIRRITDKGAFVTVDMDCCHSASGTRDVGGPAVRQGKPKPGAPRGVGVDGGDPRPRHDGNLVAPVDQLRAIVTSGGGAGTLLPAPKNYLLMTACRESETAKELGSNGVFTHYFLDVLRGDRRELTYRTVQDRVGSSILKLSLTNRHYDKQTPQLEGNGRLILFGGGAVAEPNALVATPRPDGTVLLPGAGAAVGVTEGTTLALYPPGATRLDDPKAELGTVRVISVRPDAAIAERGPGTDPAKLVAGMRAVIVHPGDARVRRRVALVGDGPPIDAVRRAIAGAGMKGTPSPYVELVAHEDRPELSVAIGAGRYEIRDEDDRPLPRMKPLPITGDESARAVVRRLEHVVRYRNAWQLRNDSADSSLAGKLAISVVRVAGRSAGRVELKPGETVRFLVHNNAGRDLSAALLYFGPNWDISRMWPDPDGGAAYAQLAGSSAGFQVWEAQVELPEGFTESLERLKLFATDAPTSFDALTLPALDQGTRSLTRSIARNPLEALLADIDAGARTRELVRRTGTGDWGTAELELQTRA